jgi:hypothetical protein
MTRFWTKQFVSKGRRLAYDLSIMCTAQSRVTVLPRTSNSFLANYLPMRYLAYLTRPYVSAQPSIRSDGVVWHTEPRLHCVTTIKQLAFPL